MAARAKTMKALTCAMRRLSSIVSRVESLGVASKTEQAAALAKKSKRPVQTEQLSHGTFRVGCPECVKGKGDVDCEQIVTWDELFKVDLFHRK
uniref:Uncharacterized protein n=1 Tax=Hanusia phi TaxID=3032 RepID=A0A7S0ES56_9CRYP